VCENRVQERLYGPKTEQVTGELRKLHHEQLYDLYSLRNIIRVTKSRRMRWAGYVVRMGNRRSAYRVLVGKPEGKKALERPRCI
jgi:hypothetical protein